MSTLPNNQRFLLLGGVAIGLIAPFLYLKTQQQQQRCQRQNKNKKEESKNLTTSTHWQSTDEGRQKEKSTRLEKWGPAEFPKEYKVIADTRNLFTKYAKLIEKNIPNDDDIRLRIKLAFEEAIRAFPFRCIYALAFAYPRIIWHPDYNEIVLNNKKNKKDLRAIDLGCCMGTESRQLLVDGIRQDNLLGIDIQKEFIDIGVKLFDDYSSFKERFVICNVLEDGFEKKVPLLQSFIAKGVDIVYCGAVYHLLCQEDTYKLTKAVASILSPGGIYFGSSGGSSGAEPIFAKTVSQEDEKNSVESPSMQFLHSTTSFKEMLHSCGFVNAKVQLVDRNKVIKNLPRPGMLGGREEGRGHLVWSAERL